MTGRAKASFDGFNTQAAWMRRLVFILLVGGGLWLGLVSSRMGVKASPLMQATTLPKIVISEFRTNGAGGGADEFIELFNAGDTAVDIGGWQVWGSNTTPVVGLRHTVPLGIVLSPGQHYLLANTSTTITLPADASYSSGIVDAGGIGLVMPVPQTGTPTITVVIDAVGMSSSSAFQEGTPLSTVGSFGNGSYERRLGGLSGNCWDTNNNSADFFLNAIANPQNLSSTPVFCATPSDTPTLTATFTLTNTPTITDTPTITNTPTITPTPSITNTPTNTATPTATGTITPTFTSTSAPTPVPAMSVIINEVAWAGTAASLSDEWIELYNPGSQPINLAGWHLISSDNSPDILLTGTIPATGFYLLERGDDTTIKDIPADQIYTGDLSNSGETLRLYSLSGNLVDTANINAVNKWYGGSTSPTYGSMERRLGYADGPFSWITNIGVVRNGLDANGNPINGTPKRANWANSVTPTPTSTATRTRTPTRAPSPTITRTPTAIKDFVILNEVLPHALTDLNGDGRVDVGDEYIELINLSNMPVSLQGWLLDDRNPSTGSYAFPAVLLSPGERMAFFSTQTGQYLSDGGDTVVLIRPGGAVADFLTYPVIDKLGQSWCRVPDGTGTWYFGCIPSPNLPNTYQPNPVPTATPTPAAMPEEVYFAACPLSNVDVSVQLAECVLPGLDIWNPYYWDAPDFNTLPMEMKNENGKPVSLQ